MEPIVWVCWWLCILGSGYVIARKVGLSEAVGATLGVWILSAQIGPWFGWVAVAAMTLTCAAMIWPDGASTRGLRARWAAR